MEAIRENQEAYLAELKGWLKSTKGEKLEEMVDFFHARLESYEEHMEIWKEAYCYMAEQVKHYLAGGRQDPGFGVWDWAGAGGDL